MQNDWHSDPRHNHADEHDPEPFPGPDAYELTEDTTGSFDLVDWIIRFENGEVEDEADLVAGFQHLVDDGTVWHLQGFYGRVAQDLIDAGLVTVTA